MRTTTYKCDKCGKEDTSNETLQLEKVGVHVGEYNVQYSYSVKPKLELNQEWCKDCRVKAGLAIPPKNKIVEVTPMTLEDLVHDIAYEAAIEAIQNS